MRNFIFCCLALLLLPAFASAQTIKGKVLDESGLPLPGVSVLNTATTATTITDMDGNFAIPAAVGASLKFTFVGYIDQTVAANVEMSVKMQVSSTTLNEVVVVGYGTQKKADITGSVAVVNEKDFRNRPNSNAVSSLQGKVAGVVISNGGKPGSSAGISIRGIGSIANSNPIFVVDGVITDNIDYLNPNDIETMSLLKDASSSAIYGLRAGNGVIVIKTKTGKAGGDEEIRVQFDSSVGVSKPTNVPDLATGSQYVQLYNEKLAYEGNTDPTLQLNPNDPRFANTNWLNEVLRSSSITQTHNLTLTGASKKTEYALGLGYYTQEGILDAGKGVSSGDDYKRISGRFNTTYHITDRFRINANLIYAKSNSNDAALPIYQAIVTPSIVPVYNADGSYGHIDNSGIGTAGDANPRMTLDNFRGKTRQTSTIFSGYGEYDLLKGLTYKMAYSRTSRSSFAYAYTPTFTSLGTGIEQTSRLTNTDVDYESILWENTLNYTKEIGKHRFVLLAGYSRQQDKNFALSASEDGVQFFGDDSTLYMDLTSGAGSQNSTGAKSRLQSYFGRLQYAFDDKYLVNATIRRDGSSAFNFDGDQKTATFPSVGLGWVVSKESFMQNSGIDFLKLKGSWGRLGNASITRQYDLVAANLSPAFFGTSTSPQNAISITQLYDTSIPWEYVTEWDGGVELRVLKNRLSLEAGYYNRETTDAVFAVSIPSQAGLGTSFTTNAGSFRNKGFEFDLKWNDKINDKISYSVYGNLTTIDNEITGVLGGSFLNTGPGLFGNTIKRWEVGSEVGAYYGYEVAGVVQNAEQSATTGRPIGSFYFKDLDGNGTIDENDKKFLGSPIPNVTYGFGFNVDAYGVDLTMEFQGVGGNEIYNFNRNSRFGNENWDEDFYQNHWTTTNPTNAYPAANSDQTSSAPSSFYVEKGDYFRIRMIQLGYTLPKSFLDKVKIDKFRFYVSAQNPFTSFKYNGFSPELGPQAITDAGIDNNVYPLSAIYSFGINLNF